MRLRIIAPILVLAALVVAPAAAQSDAEAHKADPAKPEAEVDMPPQHIKVQHILIGFRGSVRGKKITRSKAEAETLAYEVLKLAQKEDADFGKLVEEYTDDAYPGIYAMANYGVAPEGGEFRRQGMVAAFGDVGFPLDVGGVGIANYARQKSPYGWHIITRLE